jgi:membrane protease YdiL (CAAX protease family)
VVSNWQLPVFVGLDLYLTWNVLLKAFPVQQDYNTALVYAVGFAFGLGALLYLRQELKESHQFVLKWESNLTKKGLEVTLLAAALLLGLIYSQSHQLLGLTFIARGSALSGVPANTSDAVYNFVIVAPSEEILVLVLMLTFILLGKSKATFSTLADPYVAAGGARLGWAALHSILAYGNNVQAILLAAALGYGFTVIMIYSGSVLSAIILHGTWNAGLLLVVPGGFPALVLPVLLNFGVVAVPLLVLRFWPGPVLAKKGAVPLG